MDNGYYVSTRLSGLRVGIFSTSVKSMIFFLGLVSLAIYIANGASLMSGVFRVSDKEHRLKNAVVHERSDVSMIDCVHLCLMERPRCHSMNYAEKNGDDSICQLNNETKLTKPENLADDSSFDYLEIMEFTCGERRSRNRNNRDHGDTGPRSCADHYKKGKKHNGIYTVDPDGCGGFEVKCDMTSDGGGWTVIQTRMDGSVDFFLDWLDYKNGFGNLDGEFWLGLDKIHRLSTGGRNVLRIDLRDFDDNLRYAKYTGFSVLGKSESYKLMIEAYSEGDAGDSLSIHNGMKFTTKDADNDQRPGANCAEKSHGGWWYNQCHNSNLNGKYYDKEESSSATNGIQWVGWKGFFHSLKETTMKIRHD